MTCCSGGQAKLVDHEMCNATEHIPPSLYANIEVMRLLFQVSQLSPPVNCNLIDSSLGLFRRWHEISIMPRTEDT